jgi:hypothetical protein
MSAAPAPVAVVTDSTASLPADLVERYRLAVVPLQVVVDGRSLAEGVEVSSDEVAAALRERRPVTTSRPSPQTFVDTYRALGVPEVVSVHLSADLSGTVDAARAAARQVADDGVKVVVVDSRSLGMGLGLTARAAAQAAEQGADADEAARVARRLALDVAIWLYVDTLEYLRRGGRINAPRTAGSSPWSGCGRRAGRSPGSRSWRSAGRVEIPSTSPSSTSPPPIERRRWRSGCSDGCPSCDRCTSGRSVRSSGRTSVPGCWGSSWPRPGKARPQARPGRHAVHRKRRAR